MGGAYLSPRGIFHSREIRVHFDPLYWLGVQMEYPSSCPVFTRSKKESQRPSYVLDDYFWLSYREWMGDLWLNNAGCLGTFLCIPTGVTAVAEKCVTSFLKS